MNTKRNAFTLIELLVVIAIIVLMMSILLSAVQLVRFAALRAIGTNNVKNLNMAALHYEAVNGRLPPVWKTLHGVTSSVIWYGQMTQGVVDTNNGLLSPYFDANTSVLECPVFDSYPVQFRFKTTDQQPFKIGYGYNVNLSAKYISYYDTCHTILFSEDAELSESLVLTEPLFGSWIRVGVAATQYRFLGIANIGYLDGSVAQCRPTRKVEAEWAIELACKYNLGYTD